MIWFRSSKEREKVRFSLNNEKQCERLKPGRESPDSTIINLVQIKKGSPPSIIIGLIQIKKDAGLSQFGMKPTVNNKDNFAMGQI